MTPLVPDVLNSRRAGPEKDDDVDDQEDIININDSDSQGSTVLAKKSVVPVTPL